MIGTSGRNVGRSELIGPVPLVLAVGLTLSALSLAFLLVHYVPLILADGLDEGLWNRDLVNYWFAPQLAWSGDWATLHDADAYLAALERRAGVALEKRNWSYPPTTLLLMQPLAWLPYKAAFVLFHLATLPLFAFGAECVRRVHFPRLRPALLVPILLPAVTVNFAAAQNGWLTGAIVMLVVANWDRRPVLAGLMLGLLLVKPHLGILYPLLALADRRWSLILSTVASGTALIGASCLLYGPEAWIGYMGEIVPYQARVPFDWSGGFLYMMLGALPHAIREGAAHPWVWHVPVALGAFAGFVLALVSVRSSAMRHLALLVATFLVLPYGFDYDATALSALAGMLALSMAKPNVGGAPVAGLLLALVAVLPAVAMRLHVASGWPVAPIVLAGALVAVVAWARTRAGADAARPVGADPGGPGAYGRLPASSM